MSSKVPRKDRVQREPRKRLEDFTLHEQLALKALKNYFHGSVAVFGSRAKGNYANDSDLDVGIENFCPTKHKVVTDYISQHYGIKLDARTYENALSHRGAIIL